MAGLRESLCLGPAGPGDGLFICGFVSELMCFLTYFILQNSGIFSEQLHQVCAFSSLLPTVFEI